MKLLLANDAVPDLMETDLSEFGIIGVESSEILFYNGHTEVIIHRTYASPCNEITYADVDVATEIQSCNTRSSKIDTNKKQLETLCEESWFNVTKALGTLLFDI